MLYRTHINIDIQLNIFYIMFIQIYIFKKKQKLKIDRELNFKNLPIKNPYLSQIGWKKGSALGLLISLVKLNFLANIQNR